MSYVGPHWGSEVAQLLTQGFERRKQREMQEQSQRFEANKIMAEYGINLLMTSAAQGRPPDPKLLEFVSGATSALGYPITPEMMGAVYQSSIPEEKRIELQVPEQERVAARKAELEGQVLATEGAKLDVQAKQFEVDTQKVVQQAQLEASKAQTQYTKAKTTETALNTKIAPALAEAQMASERARAEYTKAQTEMIESQTLNPALNMQTEMLKQKAIEADIKYKEALIGANSMRMNDASMKLISDQTGKLIQILGQTNDDETSRKALIAWIVHLKQYGLDLPLTVEHMQEPGWKKKVVQFLIPRDETNVLVQSMPNTGKEYWSIILDTPMMQKIIAEGQAEEAGASSAQIVDLDSGLAAFGGP